MSMINHIVPNVKYFVLHRKKTCKCPKSKLNFIFMQISKDHTKNSQNILNLHVNKDMLIACTILQFNQRQIKTIIFCILLS